MAESDHETCSEATLAPPMAARMPVRMQLVSLPRLRTDRNATHRDHPARRDFLEWPDTTAAADHLGELPTPDARPALAKPPVRAAAPSP